MEWVKQRTSQPVSEVGSHGVEDVEPVLSIANVLAR